MARAARQSVTTAIQSTTDNSGDSELAARLRLAVMRLARRLRQQTESGLSPTLVSALVSVDVHGPLMLGSLAEIERVKRPTVTRIVAALEERRLVVCEADPADGRARVVAITAAGKYLLRRDRTRKTAYLARHLAELSSDDTAKLTAAIDVLERLLEYDR
jgi:DNA-binding MarR family transcriptional regulator